MTANGNEEIQSLEELAAIAEYNKQELNFDKTRADNEQLMKDLAKVLNCNQDTKCEIVFAGRGFLQLSFSDGHEDSFVLNFVGLGEARKLAGY